MAQSPVVEEIKSILHDNIIAGGLSAAITSSRSSPIQIHAGNADIAKSEELNGTHLFGIGSITKVFVAVVVFQLIEESKLQLSDTVSQHLSDGITHDIDNARSATIAQLLSHEAGIDSWEDDPKWIVDGRGAKINIKRIWSKTDTLDYVRRPKITAPRPGQWYYSNTNYTLLGLIIEKITTNTAEGEIRRRILEPLGMEDTFFDGFESSPAGRTVACRYHYATPQFRETAGVSLELPFVQPHVFDATGSNLSVSWTAGGMISSTTDLCKFALALRDRHLLKPSSMQTMQDWRPTTIPGHGMGHGLFKMSLAGKGSWLGHSGGVLGFSSGLWWKEDEDCVVCVMSNCGTVHAGKIEGGVAGVIRESELLNLASSAVVSSHAVG